MKMKFYIVVLCLLSLPVAGQASTYAALGDSLAAGLGASPPETKGYVPLVRDYLAATRGGTWTLYNHGVVGATAAGVLESQVAPAIANNPDVVTLDVGSNDVTYSVVETDPSEWSATRTAFRDQFKANFYAIVQRLKQNTGAQIVVANIPQLTATPAAAAFPAAARAEVDARVALLNAVIAQTAGEFSVPVVDLHANQLDAATDFSGDGYHPNNSGYAKIADLFKPALTSNLTLKVNNQRPLLEGSAAAPNSAVFFVVLSGASSQTVTVRFITANGTATAGADYLAKRGILTFSPGQTIKKVTVPFIGDDVAELNETLFLDIRAPVGATISDSRGNAIIRNDDGSSVMIADALTVKEGDPLSSGAPGTTPQKFMVRLSAASTNTITVDWTTANGTAGPDDYAEASGRLTFAPGEIKKTITVQVKGDATVEPNETYKVNLKNPIYAVLGDSQGVAYIRNDDTAPSVTAH